MKKRNTREFRNRHAKQKSHRKISWNFILFMAAVPAIVYLVYSVSGSIFYSPFFKIKKITTNVSGFDLSSFYGQNIYTVSLPEVADSLRKDPWVFRVTAHRVFPDALYVSVVSRAPFAYLVLPARRLLVTRDGTVVPDEKCLNKPNLEIYGLKPTDLPGSILPVVSVYDCCRFFVPLKSMTFSSGFLTLVPDAGGTIFLPDESLEEKLFILRRLLAEFQKKGLRYKYLDLRFDDPVFLPDSEST